MSNKIKPITERCIVEEFLKKEQKKHPSMRQKGVYIVCRCKRCNPSTLSCKKSLC